MTTTQLLPATYTVYRLVIAARDNGDPARLVVLDVVVIVNDTLVAGLSRHAHGSLLADERFLAVFGVSCGVTAVFLLACIVCASVVLRRSTSKAPCDSSGGHKNASSTLVYRQSLTETADGCITSSNQYQHDWHNEYTNMIDVRM